jgi:dimethylargininase
LALVALTRPVPDALASCQLTHIERTPLDVTRARAQHAGYEQLLTALGCEVRHVPPAHHLADSVFIEDTAVVLDELAIVTRPGAPSRQPETEAVATALAPFRDMQWLAAPATLDGGDVLRLGRTLYVGTGGRSNEAAVEQLSAATTEFGYAVRAVTMNGCLHLKSAATEVAPGLVLVNPRWVPAAIFSGHHAIEVDPEEPFAANVLRVGNVVVCARAFPRTAARLDSAGIETRTLDVSELAKAEGALTCCSLMFNR